MDKFFKDRKYYIFTILFAMLLWGSAIPIIKIGYLESKIPVDDNFAKIYYAGLRFFIAGLFVLIYMKIFIKDKIELKKLDYKFLTMLAITQITLQYLFLYIGAGNTTGMKSSILQSSSTFIIVILSSIVFKDDKINKYKVYAIIIGFIGIIITNMSSDFTLSFNLTGEGFVILGALFNGIAAVFVKAKGSKTSPLISTFFQMIIGSSILIIIGLVGKNSLLYWTNKGILLLLYGGFLSATAFSLWYGVLKYNKSGDIAIYMMFIPIFGSIISSILLPDEYFSVRIVVGLILVILGTIILNLNKEIGELNEDKIR